MGVMSLAQIMDKSVDILRKYIKTIVLFTLGYGVLCFGVIFAAIIAIAIFSAFAIGADPGIASIVVLTIFGIIFGLFAFALFLSTNIGLIKIASQAFFEEKIYAHQAFGAAFKSIPKLWCLTGLLMLMFIPVLGAMWGIAYFAFTSIEYTMLGQEAFGMREVFFIIFIYIAFIAIMIIALAIFAWFSFALHAIVIEKKGVFGSLKRSCGLVKNNYWRILGTLFLINLTIYAVNTSLQSFAALVSGILFIILKFLNVPVDYMLFFSNAYTYANWPVSILSWLVISPLAMIMLTLLYFNQRFKKEGFDMGLKLKEIEKNAERKHLSEVVE